MRTKDKKELHLKSLEELKNLIVQAKDALAGLKLDKTQNKLKNPRLLFIKRREIAQMLTVARGKELALESKKI
ncbi:MAG: 50S ribosomal protein L29 [Candidatus Levybacteria bacterium]|nr:50S ribosomal protein L29 [Candidatus Levybacteria bacterium]